MNLSTNGTTHQPTTVFLPTLAEALTLPVDERTEKAIMLVEEGRVTIISDSEARVKSSTNTRKVYSLTSGICSCKDTEYRNNPDGCAHARAVRLQRALAQYQAVPPQDAPPPWTDDVDQSYDIAAAQEAYRADIEEGKNRTPTAQEVAWNKVSRDFDKPTTPLEAQPKATAATVPESTPPVTADERPPKGKSSRKAEPKHVQSWRDKEPRFVHSLKWRDTSGIEHMTVIRSDNWNDLQGDIAEASTFAMPNVAKPRTEGATPAPREEAAPAETPDPSWCTMHQCQMSERSANGDTWYAHKSSIDGWCKGPKKAKR